MLSAGAANSTSTERASNKDQILNPCSNKDPILNPCSNKDQVVSPGSNKDILSCPGSNQVQVLSPGSNKEIPNSPAHAIARVLQHALCESRGKTSVQSQDSSRRSSWTQDLFQVPHAGTPTPRVDEPGRNITSVSEDQAQRPQYQRRIPIRRTTTTLPKKTRATKYHAKL
ncbi:hypothetical protein ACLKA6_013951 [Drosophila palustris]